MRLDPVLCKQLQDLASLIPGLLERHSTNGALETASFWSSFRRKADPIFSTVLDSERDGARNLLNGYLLANGLDPSNYTDRFTGGGAV